MSLPVYLYVIPVDNPSQKLVENDHYKTRLSLKKKSATHYPLWSKVGHFFFPKKVGHNGYNPCMVSLYDGAYRQGEDFNIIRARVVNVLVLCVKLEFK